MFTKTLKDQGNSFRLLSIEFALLNKCSVVMLALKCLVVLLIVSSTDQLRCGRKGTLSGLIVGGTRSRSSEWPWLASLIDIPTQKFFCGATIISEKVLITAAHCLQPKSTSVSKNTDEVVAFLGKQNVKVAFERGVEAFYPNEIFVHPDWKIHSNRYDADLAILRSESSIRFSTSISPVCLWSENLIENENIEGVVVGWGSSNASQLSEFEAISRHMNIKRVSSQKCYEDFHLFATISSSRTFCGGAVDVNSGPCSGDSGGGFYISMNNVWYINGIVSAAFLDSEGRCDINKYTLFTKVSPFTNWISPKVERSVLVTTLAPSIDETPVNYQRVCWSVDDLYGKRDRRYLKSMCTISGLVSYQEAKRNCRELGMQLFVVRNKIEQTAFIDALNSLFRSSKSTAGWVNGERNERGKWVSYNPHEAQLFNKLKWGDSNTSSGNWLRFERHSGSQYFSSQNSQPEWTHCEFIDSS